MQAELANYSDGYKAELEQVIGKDGVLANAYTGVCFGEGNGTNGLFCHYALAGEEDYEINGHSLTYWELPEEDIAEAFNYGWDDKFALYLPTRHFGSFENASYEPAEFCDKEIEDCFDKLVPESVLYVAWF